MSGTIRLTKTLQSVNKAEDQRRLKAMERFWIQDTPKVHALNYWFYRYFTNEFELYILDAIHFHEIKEEKKE